MIAPLLVLSLGACERYHPAPLTSAAVEQALRVEDAETLRVRAAQLEHPILRPIRLDPREGLSPQAAAVLAVLVNPQLRAVRDRRVLADAQLLQAGLLPRPELAYDLDVPTGGETTGTVDAFGIGLSWEATSLIARSARRARAAERRAAVEMDIAWQEWQVAQAAKRAVVRLVSLQRQLDLAERTRQRLADSLALLRRAVAEGTRTASDASAAELAALRATQRVLELRKQTGEQDLELHRLLGLAPEAPVRLEAGIELPDRFDPPPAEQLLAGLEKRRLDLVALRRGYDSQEAAVRAAILDQFPGITIGPVFGREIENVSTAGFALTIRLPIFDRNRGRIAVERATRKRLFDEYVNRIFETRSDIEIILSGIRSLNDRLAAAREAEPRLQGLVDHYGEALAEGRVDALTYYRAWSELEGSRAQTLALQGDLAEAVVALELATGMYEIPHPVPAATGGRAGHEAIR